MTTRFLAPACAVALLIGLLSEPAAGQGSQTKRPFYSGPWNGYASYNEDGFLYCGIHKYMANETLGFGITSYKSLIILVGNTSWNLGDGLQYDLVVRVDDRQTRRVTGTGRGSALTIVIGEDWPFFSALRKGYTLYIETSKTVLTYSLEGTYHALNKTLECTLQETQLTSQNPFGTRKPSDSYPDQGDYLTQRQKDNLEMILVAAGLDEVNMISPSVIEQKLGIEEPMYAWTALGNEIFGFLNMYSNVEEFSTRDIARVLNLTVSSVCTGQYGNAVDDTVMSEHGEVLRGSVFCITRATDIYLDYVIINRQQTITAIVHVSTDRSVSRETKDVSRQLVNLFR